MSRLCLNRYLLTSLNTAHNCCCTISIIGCGSVSFLCLNSFNVTTTVAAPHVSRTVAIILGRNVSCQSLGYNTITSLVSTLNVGRAITIVCLGRVICLRFYQFNITSVIGTAGCSCAILIIRLRRMLSFTLHSYLLTIYTKSILRTVINRINWSVSFILCQCYLPASRICTLAFSSAISVVFLRSMLVTSLFCYLCASANATHNIGNTVVIIITGGMLCISLNHYLSAMLTLSILSTICKLSYRLVISSCLFNHISANGTIITRGTIFINTAIGMHLYARGIVCSARASVCVSVLALISIYNIVCMRGRCSLECLNAIYKIFLLIKILIATLTMIMRCNGGL